MSGLIVVGVDGSEGSRRALAWAVEEARLRRAALRAVLAWSYLDQPEGTFDPQYGQDDADRRLDEALASVPGAADVTVERAVVNDLPAPALLDAAPEADLLVVGSRGLGGFAGLLLGSVSGHVALNAPCPVVIVPGPERDTASGATAG